MTRRSSATMLQPPQPQHGSAEPEPLLHRQPAPGGPSWPRTAAQGGLVVDPVAERGRQQPAEPWDIPHRHPEGPDAAVVLPDAQHHQVALRMPGHTQPSPALVEKHIPAGGQRSPVLHRPSLVAPAAVRKPPAVRRGSAVMTAANEPHHAPSAPAAQPGTTRRTTASATSVSLSVARRCVPTDTCPMPTAHRLHQADRRHRTALCDICGPTAIRREHLIGPWRCVRDGSEGRRRRRTRREREALDLAHALMRSPRPPI
jgi:hypothetical protein